jgi:phage recombination protein Bet
MAHKSSTPTEPKPTSAPALDLTPTAPPIPAATNGAIAVVKELPPDVARRGINEWQWRTLCSSLFPGANPRSVLMVIDYCKARGLDPLKKPCHIVPMDVKVGDHYESRDVVMPGIYELRTTAQRTGEYLGHERPTYGPLGRSAGVQAPEWCDFTVYRWNAKANTRAPFPVRVLFLEVVATRRDGTANARWAKAPTQMLTKCAEAAALREAFPDEIGGEMTMEEMEGKPAADVDVPVAPPPPADYDEKIKHLTTIADQGFEAFDRAFACLPDPVRDYLANHDTPTWERLKQRAQAMPEPVP